MTKIRLALRITGENLDIEEVTTLLSQQPSLAGKKGDKRSTPKGKAGIFPVSIWLLEGDNWDISEINEGIYQLLKNTNQDPQVWQRITKASKAEVFCGLFADSINVGLELTPKTMQLLSQLNIQLSLDIYSDSNDDQRSIIDEQLSEQHVLAATHAFLESCKWSLAVNDEIISIPINTPLFVRSRMFVAADMLNVFLSDHYEAIVEIGRQQFGEESRAKYAVLRLYFNLEGNFVSEDRYSPFL